MKICKNCEEKEDCLAYMRQDPTRCEKKRVLTLEEQIEISKEIKSKD